MTATLYRMAERAITMAQHVLENNRPASLPRDLFAVADLLALVHAHPATPPTHQVRRVEYALRRHYKLTVSRV